MSAIRMSIAAILLAAASASPAAAQYAWYPHKGAMCCGPYCQPAWSGYATYGPARWGMYSPVPPFAPYNGERPCLQGCGPGGAGPQGPMGPLGFPTHPYARSPRDFFMMDQ